jgi:hypothetical protein
LPVCHTPQFTTAANAAEPELANQVIRPYSDLLLHDMGDGLADDRTEFAANGRDWRTPPLWGIGLTQDGQWPHPVPARRPRPQPARSRALARRRSQAARNRF